LIEATAQVIDNTRSDPAHQLDTGPCGHCRSLASAKCAHPCLTYYCDKTCQKAAWKLHKLLCKGRTVRFPIQQLVQDATLQACRAPYMRGSKVPNDNTLVFITIDTLATDMCTYSLQICHGEACPGFVDGLVHKKYINSDSGIHKALTDCLGADRQDLFIVILRIHSLEMQGIKYKMVGADPKDNGLIILEPSGPADVNIVSGSTRLSVQTYTDFRNSKVAIEHFPLVLTGTLAPGSPVEAAMAEQTEHGRHCAVCMESKQQFVLSDCDHPICYDCGRDWRQQQPSASASCPICRRTWTHFDSIYSNSLEQARAKNHFERFRCCWCGRIAKYRCGCQCYEYCSIECKKAHATSTRAHECINPWFLPTSQRLAVRNGCLQWVHSRFEEVTGLDQ
jgi:hypothetical protein